MRTNQGLDIEFSLIIPTRERRDKLEKCLMSFFRKADNPGNQEAILLVDLDDKTYRNFADFVLSHNINVKIIQVPRTLFMVRDYNNYGTQCALGKFIWMLNDDFEVVTDHWDRILKERIEKFCFGNGDNICYVSVDDSTHTAWNSMETLGCCCPIISREACETMNGVMPWQINSWGADTAIFAIFKRLTKNRILNCVPDIKVLHHCRHNFTSGIDNISRRVEKISSYTKLNQEEQDIYVSSLLSKLSNK